MFKILGDNMANKICKIVYFDEDSVTDYVQIVAGGSLETTTELLKSSEVNEKQEVGATVSGGGRYYSEKSCRWNNEIFSS